MGDNLSVVEKKNFQEKLQFIQRIEDHNFGLIEVFRFKEPPYEYIMDYQKTFIEGDLRYQPYQKFLSTLKQIQHKNLAKIHYTQTVKQNHMCIKDTKVHTYCNYYNFTLKQAIQKKKIKDVRFSESQLSYIFSCLLDLAVFFKKLDIVIGDFRSERIYLSPEGYIKLFSVEFEKENKHTAFIKALTSRSYIDSVILSPEQLVAVNKFDNHPKNMDIFKCQVFAIAMIILQMMTLDKTKFYYNEDKSSLKMGRIFFDLSTLSSDYSHQFIQIVRSCLIENPSDRITLQVAFTKIEAMRKRTNTVSYCIRLHQDEQCVKKKTNISAKSQYILNGIQKRLTPSPITTLSSSASSGFASRHTTISHDEAKKRLFGQR